MADAKARWVKRAAKATGMESEDVAQIVTYLMSCEPGSIEELAISMLGDSDNVKRLARDMRDELRPKAASGGPTREMFGVRWFAADEKNRARSRGGGEAEWHAPRLCSTYVLPRRPVVVTRMHIVQRAAPDGSLLPIAGWTDCPLIA